MKRRIVLSILTGCLFLVGGVSYANSRYSETQFLPQVYVYHEHSHGQLELSIGQPSYQALYDVDLQRFRDLKLEFVAKSTSGEPVDYKLNLSVFENHCEEKAFVDSDDDIYPLEGIALTLDDIAIDMTDENADKTNHLNYQTQSENLHRIMLRYPQMEQKNHVTVCYGIIGIVATSIGVSL